MSKFKFSFQFTCIFVFIAAIIFSQSNIEKNKITKNEMLYFVPKKEHLAYTNFGFKSVVADLLWLRGTSYFMYHFGKDNDYKYLYGMFNASVALDPQFKQVYRDAMTLLLCDKEHFSEAEKLILVGVRNMPKDWEMRYMAGTLYAYYLKNDNESLKHLEQCWGLIPREEKYKHELENVNIMIKSITEKKNDKSGLVLYWINKCKEQQTNESKEFCSMQIRKYVSALMVEKINEIIVKDLNEEEKKKILGETMDLFKLFYTTNHLSDYIEVPLDVLFVKTDAFGYPWVFSERELKYYSFGIASEYLNRKINLFNIKLWEKLEKYMSISVNELTSYYPNERVKYLKLKPEFSQFPAFEEVYNEKNNWLKLEYPLFPIYDRMNGCFRVPKYNDLATIDNKYK